MRTVLGHQHQPRTAETATKDKGRATRNFSLISHTATWAGEDNSSLNDVTVAVKVTRLHSIFLYTASLEQGTSLHKGLPLEYNFL